MASNPTTSWQIKGEKVQTVTDFIFLDPKVTTDGDSNHEIKKCLLLGKKAMKSLDSILKSRDITLLTKVHTIRAMVFPVIMYGYESWTIKKAEWQRIDAFKLWCWTILLRVPWTARKSNKSILKEISPEYSLEELMIKLKLQYFGHLMQRVSVVEARGLSSYDSQAVEHRLNSYDAHGQLLHSMWDLPGAKIRPVSSSLAENPRSR